MIPGMQQASVSVEIAGAATPSAEKILTPKALAFVADLHRTFNPTREKLLARREARQVELDQGAVPDFLADTAEIRKGDWRVAATPGDLQKRWVEITGPVTRKMMINAFNCGANVFMADFEDALSPTWENVVEGQQNLVEAVRRTLSLDSGGKQYRLNDRIATLLVRPRGWHLLEKHVLVDGHPISGSLFDFGLFVFHNASETLARESGPYFYLPKLESHLEARLWNDVFNHAQDALGIPRGTIRATVLIETIMAAFEMDEILYELRDHSAGLNAGRWDYIFSLVKKFRTRKDLVLPDRVQITMAVPFMRAYTNLLVQTCHRRGAHAVGGMAAFIPSRRDADVNKVALAKVTEDKERESSDGFDGSWIAHPDLVPVAKPVFEKALGGEAHQKHRSPDATVEGRDLIDLRVPGGQITETGIRNNVSVAIQYLAAWLGGNGAVGINNLMEDAATAEISRSQLWQWVHNGATMDDGRVVDLALYQRIRDEELAKLPHGATGHTGKAVELLDSLVTSPTLDAFLTLGAYDQLG
jgi:malate synthase